MKACKYPYPETHSPLALLDLSVFRTIQMRVDGPFEGVQYITDNCEDCIDLAGRNLASRGYRVLSLSGDTELVHVAQLLAGVASKVRAATTYLETPPIVSRAPDPYNVKGNWQAYRDIVGQFPPRVRSKIRRPGTARLNPQVAANSRRRQTAISDGTWVQMFKTQEAKCACCHELFRKHPHMDHNHKTGRVRALLCGDCNLALGFARDSVERLNQLIRYLQEHTA